MNNIRKIIEERLENARNDYRYWLSGIGCDGVIEPDFYKIEGQIEAYQDCLNLMQPRTEQDILNDFEKLGWKVTQNDVSCMIICFDIFARIVIFKGAKQYSMNNLCTMQEHKLLNELFEVWQWI